MRGARRISEVFSASLVAALVAIPSAVLAQSSTTYKLTEHVLNAGGRPAQAVTSSSPSYRLSLDSIGEPVRARSLAGAYHGIDGGFVSSLAPPGEVDGLQFLADQHTLTWLPEDAAAAFNVYSGPLSALPGTYGACSASPVSATSWGDPSVPAPGSGRFYLVTGVNRLVEEGTKGAASNGVQRPNPAPCPP